MLVELKNGETLNGHLVTCDTWMNLTLKEVVQTSPVCCPTSNNLPRRCAKERQERWLTITLNSGWRQVFQITRGLCQGQQCMYSLAGDE